MLSAYTENHFEKHAYVLNGSLRQRFLHILCFL